MAGIDFSNNPFMSNLGAQYQSPQQMALSNAQANEAQANANYTAGPQSYLTQQQGYANYLANQITTAKLPAIQAGIQKYLDYNKNLNTDTNQGSQQLTDNNSATDDDVERTAARNYMPMPTTPEMVQADAGAVIAGLPPTAVASNDAKNAQMAQRAALEFVTANPVGLADVGTRMGTLARIDPQAAAAYASAHPQYAGESDSDYENRLDTDAGIHFAKAAAAAHQYSGRGIDITPSGVVLDHPTGMVIAGTDQLSNISKKDLVEIKQKGETIVDTMVNGQPAKLPLWQADGAPSEAVWDAEQVRDFRNQNRQNDAKPQPAAGQGGGQPTNPNPKAPAQVNGPTPTNTNPKAPSSAAPAAPAAATQPASVAPPGGLPGVDPDKLPKTPRVGIGQPAAPGQLDAVAAERKNSAEIQADATKTGTLLSEFQGKLNNVNPRDVGPGSPIYKAFLDLKAAVTGSAPNDLVDQGILEKFAAQMGYANARQAMQGQKITNQEMMGWLEHASASTTQPLDVMKTIVAFAKANNTYDRQLATTKLAALDKGANPVGLDGAIDPDGTRRTNFVSGQMTRDLTPPGAPVVSSADEYKALPPGAAYRDPQGITRKKPGGAAPAAAPPASAPPVSAPAPAPAPVSAPAPVPTPFPTPTRQRLPMPGPAPITLRGDPRQPNAADRISQWLAEEAANPSKQSIAGRLLGGNF